MPMVGPSDACAVNPGMFIPHLLTRYVGSTVVVRRHLGDEERKLLRDVDAREELFGDVGLAVGKAEDDLDDLPHAAQGRRSSLDRRKRGIAAEGVRDSGV